MLIRSYRRHFAVSLFACLFTLVLSGCGGSSTPVPANVTITPLTSSVSIRGQQAFTAVAKDTGGNVIGGATFTWASSAPDVASINASGVATGVSPGNTTILATSNAGNIKSNTATLTVTPVINTITISPTSATIGVGGTQQFTATAYDINNNVVTTSFQWTNTNAGVASIDPTGLATGVAAGTTTITATASGKSSSGATLTVQ